MKYLASALTLAMVAAGPASAQIVVDGTADANYGPALSIQNTDSHFGNSTDPDPRTSAGGSELDQVFGTVDNGFLYLMFAGNLENNFNKLEIFIDSVAGGMNTIDGANVPAAVDAFCCGGFGTTDGALQRMSGMTFDAGFEADYYVTISNGTESTGGALGVSGWIATAHYAELNNGPTGANVRVGGVLDPFGDELDGTGASRGLPLGTIIDQNNNLWPVNGPTDIPLHEFFEPWDALADPNNDLNHRDMENTIGMLMAVNNSNTAGVNFCGDSLNCGAGTTGDPQNVLTGFEIALPLAAIGNPTGDIKVTAFINGGGHDFASNQFSGDGILDVNLGSGDGTWTGNLANLDLSTVAGNQYVTISQGGLVGDLDGDGFVGIADLNIVLGNWNANVTAGDPLQGDPSGDGFVGIEDLNTVLGNWNAGTPPAGAAVPEPATLALLGLGGLAALRRR
ncbi:MAG: hypothetical protein Kow00105_02940 [Phycisphaeraceae bacterium]